ncbi:uncharacterized protein [Haliotis asinina]|uniref:uncharacterized protein n=1 Tax=Haliotis asinina TaxID=109174 RepID=UPI0035318962
MRSFFLLLCLATNSLPLEAACPSDCHYNGRCQTNTCHCYAGFQGADCSTDCGCQGHGTCAHDGTCQCETGWRWNGAQRKCVWDCHCQNGKGCIGPGECGCTHTCKYGACRNGQCVCWEGYKGEDCSHYDASIMMSHGVSVGINLADNDYFSPELNFVDIHKQSQSWLTQRVGSNAWDTKEQSQIHWRSDGYPASLQPNQKLVQLQMRGFASHEPSGQYTILYDGEGEVDVGLSEHHTVHDGKGRLVVNIPKLGDGGFTIVVLRTNPRNPIHNIRVLPPGYEYLYKRFPFHPVFLENLKRFSEIRFMDFMKTNGHQPEPTTWVTRRKTDYYSQQGPYGAAVEYMIHLANTLGANPWFNMPHAADDDYIRNFAQLVKKDLRPDLKVYIEYSNEVWNPIFRQHVYAMEQGKKLNLDPANWKAGMKFYSKRAAQVADIWRQVYGSLSSRLYPVFSWQTGFQDYFKQAVDAVGSKISNFKALAITGYFSCNKVADDHGAEMIHMSMAQIQQYCKNELPTMQKSFQYFMDLAKTHHLQLVMYEGGPSVMQNKVFNGAASNQAITDKAIAFNRDSHIEQPITDVMNLWYSTVTQDTSNKYPGGLFNYFSYTSTPSKYGSWGILEYTGQDPNTVPKFRAVQKFITDHYKNNVLGPKCSFVQNGALAYGCFQHTPGNFQCGQTSDNGRTWSTYPSVGQKHMEYMVLDGFDPQTRHLYIRHVNTLGANTYHVYNTRTRSWSTQNNFAYYQQESSPTVLPRMPNGVYGGLNAHASC